jgi:hypothetical protein
MPSAARSQNSTRPDRLPTRRAAGVTWPLVKAALICFLLGLGVSRLAWTVGISPVPFALLATIAFAVCVVVVWLGVVLSDGISARLFVSVVACLLFGVVMLVTLRQPKNPFVDSFLGMFGSAQQGADRATILVGQAFKKMLSNEHLATASDLIFEKGTQYALNEARQHLRSIPPMAMEYKSAQALLQVADIRLNEFQVQSGRQQTKTPIQIIARDRTDDRLRVTFRNVGHQTVRRFRYSIAFFRVTDGWHVEPDKQSEIADPLGPWQTRTVEISDDVLTRREFNASVAVVGWEVVPTS